MASNNFLQWNAGKVNQDTDGEYVLETQRIGGAVSGLFPSKLANKLFYQCTIMVAAMGEMMKDKGFEMSDAVFADLITSLSHILTDAQFGSSAGTVCQGNDPRLDRELPTATKVWFWQNVAPTGWTIDATAATDAVLAVKSGSGTYAVAGGSSAGTWTQPNHLHTTADHTLTIGEIPSHSHGIQIDRAETGTGRVTCGGGEYYGEVYNTVAAGGGLGHNHGNTGNGATANTWRPLANVGIICSRNA